MYYTMLHCVEAKNVLFEILDASKSLRLFAVS